MSFRAFAQKNKRSIIEALIYPTFLVFVMIAALIVVVNVILSRFVDIYSNSTIPIPAATQFLLNIGELMRRTVYIQRLALIDLVFLYVESL